MDSDYENEDSENATEYLNTNSNPKLSSYRESMQNILLGL